MKDLVFEDFIEQLRETSDIVGIISDYVPLKKRGKNYWGCCPFHHEKTPSFSVTPDKGFFYCFGCQTGGNVYNFLMKIENIGFLDAVKLLANKMNVSLPAKEKSEREKIRDQEINKIYQATELARDFFFSCLTKTNLGKTAREYLAARGVADQTIETYKIGFAPPQWDKLSLAFLERGISLDVLLKSGLAVSRQSGRGVYDRFRNRIIFPICDARGRVIGFGGRVIDNSQPKYLNSPETLIFNKRHVLYGFDIAYENIRGSGQAIVVEGYMDAITAHCMGIKNVVASLGTAFTPEQARQILKCNVEMVFSYDSDSAGQNATLRALEVVRALGAKIRVVQIPDGKDPDEFLRKYGSEAYKLLIQDSLPLVEYQISQALANTDFSSIESKIAAVAKLVPILAVTRNQVETEAHISRLSQLIGVDEGAFRAEIRKYIIQSKKDNNVKNGKNINIAFSSQKPIPARTKAERQIIRLMFDEPSLIPYVATQLKSEEVHGSERIEIINFIFNAYNMEKNITPAILYNGANNLSEKAATELSHIMLMDIEFHDIAQFVDGCIRAIRLAHLTALYEQHRLTADELERMGDSNFLQELAESQRIKNEISKLHQL
ncbi:MAG TPA: DNA primase [Methylomusa anaerophila]|uniref:DNA primase n=1 Tax=Methylomusa anaerophila TaxID=1930071 RepID=A0A348AP07_9FIRM|nr:DNA primase [Methylomusa anaerophila]BBB92805.1 DNA primase [Methylomusa anaerophila]HML87344.1 DNA primase [Methylomusa anaerophila]